MPNIHLACENPIKHLKQGSNLIMAIIRSCKHPYSKPNIIQEHSSQKMHNHPETGSQIPSISTEGAAMKAIINTEVAFNKVGIIKTPNHPM